MRKKQKSVTHASQHLLHRTQIRRRPQTSSKRKSENPDANPPRKLLPQNSLREHCTTIQTAKHQFKPSEFGPFRETFIKRQGQKTQKNSDGNFRRLGVL